MNIKETKKVIKEVEEIVHNYEQCDKSKQKIKVSTFDAFECRLDINVGNRYPEGGNYVNTSMDLCQNCSQELIELLQINGYRLNEEDNDY